MRKVLCALTTSCNINVANMADNATVPAQIILSGSETPVANTNGVLEYRFSSPDTGWFTTIRADDEARLSAVLKNPNPDASEFTRLAVVVKPIVSLTAKDVASFVPAFGGAK